MSFIKFELNFRNTMSSKRFKYQEFLEKFDNCPPENFKEVEIKAFRWVFEECGQESFLPVLIIDPLRKFGNDKLKCSGYAISMFEDKRNACVKYKKLIGSVPKFQEKVGTCIAEINIDIKDGICSTPEMNNYLHFDLHLYFVSDLSKKVLSIAIILDDDGNING